MEHYAGTLAYQNQDMDESQFNEVSLSSDHSMEFESKHLSSLSTPSNIGNDSHNNTTIDIITQEEGNEESQYNHKIDVRVQQSAQKTYAWCSFLLKFSYIILLLSFVIFVSNIYIYLHKGYYSAYETKGNPFWFTIDNKALIIKLQLDQSQFNQTTVINLLLDLMIMGQSIMCIMKLRPLFQSINKSSEKKSKRIKSKQPSHDDIKKLQTYIFYVSIINFLVLGVLLFKVSREIYRVSGEWFQNYIASQNFEELIKQNKQLEKQIKDSLRYQQQRIEGITVFFLVIINTIAIFCFCVVNSLCIYGTHQLSRSQKRTEED